MGVRIRPWGEDDGELLRVCLADPAMTAAATTVTPSARPGNPRLDAVGKPTKIAAHQSLIRF